jgi:SPP1 gp7 family putative phage head morphogenesis protein
VLRACLTLPASASESYTNMSSIISAAYQFRAEVLRGDREMLRQLSQAYASIDKSLTRQLRELQRDIERAQREGKTVNRDWLRRSFRYQQLIRQVKGEIAGYSFNARQFIEAKQRHAIDLGQSHATGLIESALPEITFARLPTEAIQELVGVLQNGSPLSKTLDKLGPQAARDIREALITGLGSGHGVAKIAREMRKAIDMPRWNALRLARTETLRAYRQSSLATYAANDDVLDGWYWISAKSTRTCVACWDLHGTFFPLSKTFFPSHVACRCSSIPAVKGAHPNIQSGAVAFANLPAEQQQAILGLSRYEMYASGEAPLDEFVILTRDKDWGGAYQVRPLYAMKDRRKAA